MHEYTVENFCYYALRNEDEYFDRSVIQFLCDESKLYIRTEDYVKCDTKFLSLTKRGLVDECKISQYSHIKIGNKDDVYISCGHDYTKFPQDENIFAKEKGNEEIMNRVINNLDNLQDILEKGIKKYCEKVNKDLNKTLEKMKEYSSFIDNLIQKLSK